MKALYTSIIISMLVLAMINQLGHSLPINNVGLTDDSSTVVDTTTDSSTVVDTTTDSSTDVYSTDSSTDVYSTDSSTDVDTITEFPFSLYDSSYDDINWFKNGFKPVNPDYYDQYYDNPIEQ